MSELTTLFRHPEHVALVRRVLAADANRDAALFASLFADDGVFILGHAPPLRGRRAIEEGCAGFFRSLGAGLEHRLLAAWSGEGSLAWQGEVTWTLADGRRVSAPYMNALGLAGDAIRSYQVHIDASALAPPPAGFTLSPDRGGQPVIVSFDVEPREQKATIDAIERLHRETLLGTPGFVATNLHASLDGSRIVNIGHWESLEHYERFLASVRRQDGPPALHGARFDSRPYRLALQILAPGGSRAAAGARE
ncbi:MAG TPA: SgcJ/EcaC family oxidoreductase [Polyangiaceae bacterium]|nr:SgcJ/EcaC family oxidoreductase [Polyangiaceae bacterium]